MDTTVNSDGHFYREGDHFFCNCGRELMNLGEDEGGWATFICPACQFTWEKYLG